jgi:hypothetical protein
MLQVVNSPTGLVCSKRGVLVKSYGAMSITKPAV